MNYNIIGSELIKVHECIYPGKLTIIVLCRGSIIIILLAPWIQLGFLCRLCAVVHVTCIAQCYCQFECSSMQAKLNQALQFN